MKKVNGVERCRLCACEESLNSFYSIFDKNSSSDLEVKITKLLPVVVMAWDPMPHKVCHSCILKLNYFDEFYEGCLKAERLLRTLYPTAPKECLKNFEPVVEVLGSPVLDKNILYCQETCHTLSLKPETPDSSPNSNLTRTSGRFIINELTSRDQIFTCRECFRTFTKESSALTHACIRLEDCEELKNVNSVGKKSVPPLKIRLFSEKAGFFKCCLCQGQFENKGDLLSHLKLHLSEEKWREKKRRRKRRRNDNGDSLKSNNRKARLKKKNKYSGKSANDCNSSLIKKTAGSSQSQHSKEALEVKALEAEREMSDEVQEIEKPCAIEGTVRKVSNMVARREKTSAVVSGEQATDNSEEISVLEVIQKKSPTSFSSCVFCDKIFATNKALIVHQRKHLGYLGMEFKNRVQSQQPLTREPESNYIPSSLYSFHCSTCAMMFSSKKTLLEHEQYHLVHLETVL